MAQTSSALEQLANTMVSVLKSSTRSGLDTQIHCIPIDLDSLTKTLSGVIRTPRVKPGFFDRGSLNSEGSPEKTPNHAKIALSLLKDSKSLSTKIEASDIQNYLEWQMYLDEQDKKGNLNIPLDQALDIPLILEQEEPGMPESSINAIRREISDFVKRQHRKAYKYNALPADFTEVLTDPDVKKRDKYLPAVILDDRNEAMAVLYADFDKTANALYSELLNKTIKKYLKKDRYEKSGKKFSPGFDRGHTIITETGEKIATTPVLEKIDQILFLVNQKLQQAQKSSTDQVKLNKLIKDIEQQRSLLLSRSTLGTRIKPTLNKVFREKLVQIKANIVIIQDRLENQYDYATVEGQIRRNLAKIAEQLLNGTFSRSPLQEIEYRIVSILDGKYFQPNVSITKNLDKKVTGNPKRKIRVKTDPLDRSSIKKPNTRAKTTINVARSAPTLVDLSSLMIQLNSALHDQIKRNMGTGNRRDVLNYRTGRFAESVKVEKLSESRQGMITAFYSWMKNPYATFSQGGRQEIPRSRDPKSLISKSIREIAATVVGNRMRAVSL